MRTTKNRPWLTATGVAIPTEQLKQISQFWDQATWEAYLKWYERPLKARLLKPNIYKKICDQQTRTIFEKFNQSISREISLQCDRLLSTLPVVEANVLTLKFLEGRTDRTVAAKLGISKSSVHVMKNRALSRLRRGIHGELLGTREYMRGENSETPKIESSIWDSSSSQPLKEDKVYDPTKHNQELDNIQHYALRMALKELSERQRQILYLRFWCDYSLNDIARELRMGVNMIDEVCEAAISKLKRKIIQIETGYTPGEGPSCA